MTSDLVPTAQDIATRAPLSSVESFTFGDTVSAMDGADILDYAELWAVDDYFEPPISREALAKSMRAGTHHASALYFKRNVLASTFIEHPKFSRDAFRRLALDFMVFGDAYLERERNRMGGVRSYRPSPAKYTRRKTDLRNFVFIDGWLRRHEFDTGSIFQLMEPDLNQEVYGMPEYIASLQSAWLNESATLFRRRYYANGSHAGFILYVNDPNMDPEDVDAIRKALRDSKGIGNFRNLFLHSAARGGSGEKGAVQLIPISEVAAKDQFFDIKNVTRDDSLAAHRIPPQLIGIVPSNTGGFGAVEPMARVFARNEVVPLQQQFLKINEWAGEEIVRFNDYVIPTAPVTTSAV
ncbi:phage portal protein [Burkholderia lata]|uniref:Phage portal vertex protein n=1 Tax=Burkholderia lata (strain ATCC 17760 / DSM 23089 / LMG 22485 / NCIMB 9086 / R18194 / 383) TaxID=482957 RepID=A0A6P2XPW8_BURL3|nr:phage portal protein [Burkholderia lata]VWD11703.1 phage portal vertex protein [Burkholderia lata]